MRCRYHDINIALSRMVTFLDASSSGPSQISVTSFPSQEVTVRKAQTNVEPLPSGSGSILYQQAANDIGGVDVAVPDFGVSKMALVVVGELLHVSGQVEA
ncbi:hypothetical protein AYL99_05858 [Fonsecaea erecta]|uniref:Uncharacterized protein n=1 Tax=Fonsecaea erecta TaxID=1367422 RepID=A0A178ZNA5_9EURO|nr:hypothetical protein AYL99_05858 [Fonsecaea erecta]OAP60856.1 hypothetical protein AYL99_05858 [Fonsecaea erecta]